MKNLLVLSLLGAVLSGCAVTYTPPETTQTNVLLKKPIDAKKMH